MTVNIQVQSSPVAMGPQNNGTGGFLFLGNTLQDVDFVEGAFTNESSQHLITYVDFTIGAATDAVLIRGLIRYSITDSGELLGGDWRTEFYAPLVYLEVGPDTQPQRNGTLLINPEIITETPTFLFEKNSATHPLTPGETYRAWLSIQAKGPGNDIYHIYNAAMMAFVATSGEHDVANDDSRTEPVFVPDA